MNKFIPVIHEHENGLMIFRNDLINIEFQVVGETVVKTFDLEGVAAPPIPFALAGRYPKTNGVYVVDLGGTAWIENVPEEMMRQMPARALLSFLEQRQSPEADILRELLLSTDEEPEGILEQSE